ncbi:MAG: NAD(P)H-hydrate dehydratase [Lachnospiraceae bacterium]|nr:NAD(P)H-hydrate dehydratase [Lachnospiraceae bacterium]MDD7023653.1 NAD(P)H-hydrate dehydratase [Oscillospiraceae bacterium]MDY5539851.1 NAD(P)H-hydrate dehydratase [Lachnospiraceae bacterium]
MMRYVVTQEEMKRADAYTMETIGLPSLVLMERAALAVKEVLVREAFDPARVLVMCGTGNNGGDGLALARLLYLDGIDVTVYIEGDIRKGSEGAKAQYRVLQYYQVPETDDYRLGEYTVIVDALFGVGLSREVKGPYADAIDFINRSGAAVVAVDICSGIHSDTGKVLGTAVKADRTVTFAFEKAGQLLYPGAEYSGAVTVADIGITKEAFDGRLPGLSVWEAKDVKAYFPRTARSNKGTYGKVLVIAGHEGVAGAAYLSAASAYHSGCGLVRIFTEECNRPVLQTLLPEAMVDTWRTDRDSMEASLRDTVQKLLSWADAVVFGPGVGTGPAQMELFRMVLEECRIPMVLDADGLTLLSGELSLADQLPEACILTPHPGELSRLLGMPVSDILEDTLACARAAAGFFHRVVILKDAHTVTAAADGRAVLNVTGNNGMSTGGSGDVLTGILAAALALGTDPFDAGALGVWLHGAAGDRAADEKGVRSMLAGDIIRHLWQGL